MEIEGQLASRIQKSLEYIAKEQAGQIARWAMNDRPVGIARSRAERGLDAGDLFDTKFTIESEDGEYRGRVTISFMPEEFFS